VGALSGEHAPEVEKQLHEELQQVLGGRVPESADMPRLSYTERVIKEATRLYPPGWAVARTALRNCEVGGYQLRRGDNIVVSQWCMHRDARFFFDPLKFDPDRWSRNEPNPSPNMLIFPFGAGPRVASDSPSPPWKQSSY
jgi:cytochrome P450